MSWAANSWETLKSGAIGPPAQHNQGMAHPISSGCYRVRPWVSREQSVPQQVAAPLFHCRDDAEAFAHLAARDQQQSWVVEKLAPGGCWLQLATIAPALAA